MSRDEQTGRNAPRQGTLLRQSRSGVSSYRVPALDRFPPPEFLTQTQQNLWIACLSDIPLEFFRARHIPMMIQYVRITEKMMNYSDALEEDADDAITFAKWTSAMTIAMRLEKHLSLGSTDLIMLVVRARTEMRMANQEKASEESAETPASIRAGLTYVGH